MPSEIIPNFMIGKLPTVRRRCSQIIKSLISENGWSQFLHHSPGQPVDQFSANFVVDCAFARRDAVDTGNMICCTFVESLMIIAADSMGRDEAHLFQITIVDQGLETFWFTACVLAGGVRCFPYRNIDFPGDLASFPVARKFLKKIYSWSEQLDANSGKCIHCDGDQMSSFGSTALAELLGDAGFEGNVSELLKLPYIRQREALAGIIC